MLPLPLSWTPYLQIHTCISFVLTKRAEKLLGETQMPLYVEVELDEDFHLQRMTDLLSPPERIPLTNPVVLSARSWITLICGNSLAPA